MLIDYSMGIFDLKAGDRAKIVRCDAQGSAAERLSSLGVTVGKTITVLSFSLFRGSVLIGCGAVRLSMRRSLAQTIGVVKC